MNSVKIGICGLGTVGSGTFSVLNRNRADINSRAGCELVVQHIASRSNNASCEASALRVDKDIFEVARNPDIDILVELIGGVTTAKELVIQAIENGKHVVTANKALIAEHGNEIFSRARDKGVAVAFEAAVAGGIPIIKSIREGLSANRLCWLAGIINGTSNFILTEMLQKQRQFHQVLADAQALGYAEADPTFDVEGIDAAHKLAILASIAFGMPLQFNKVFTEGISAIQPQDVAYATELGYTIKHLAIARRSTQSNGVEGVELRVHPTLIPKKRLIANVDGVMNAVLVQGDAVGPTLYYGAGAGSEATASAVISDIISIARTLTADPAHRVPYLGFEHDTLNDMPIIPIESVETAYYLRMSAQDKPGVLSKITQVLSEAGISVEALIQKEPKDGEHHVPVILLTDKTTQKRLTQAIRCIEALDSIEGEIIQLRVESLS